MRDNSGASLPAGAAAGRLRSEVAFQEVDDVFALTSTSGRHPEPERASLNRDCAGQILGQSGRLRRLA